MTATLGYLVFYTARQTEIVSSATTGAVVALAGRFGFEPYLSRTLLGSAQFAIRRPEQADTEEAEDRARNGVDGAEKRRGGEAASAAGQ